MIKFMYNISSTVLKGKRMRFLKEHSYDIVKLYVNQIGIAIFSSVLYTAVGSMGDAALIHSLNTAISIFSILFYFVLVYNVAWEYGAKDKMRLDANRIQYIKAKGAKLSLVASIPNVAISMICVIFALVYKSQPLPFAAVISGVANFFMRLTMSMYLGVIQIFFGGFESVVDASFIGAAVAFAILPLLSVAVTHFGYEIGARDYKLVYLFTRRDHK